MAFLNETLADGPVEQKIVKQRAVSGGMAYRTVERAKELLGIISEREGWGPGSKCLWRLSVVDDTDDTHSTPSVLAWRAKNNLAAATLPAGEPVGADV
jgi:hypothetical protein